MLALQFNMGSSDNLLDGLLSTVLDTPASILILQECSHLAGLEAMQWQIGRSSPPDNMEGFLRGAHHAAVAIHPSLRRHVLGFRHAASNVAGIRLINIPDRDSDILISSVYLSPNVGNMAERVRLQSAALADIHTMLGECDSPADVLIGGDFNI